MNIKRLISAPILALVFLVVFAYMIAGVNYFFDSYPQNPEAFLGSISGAVGNIEPQIVSQNIPENAPLTVFQPGLIVKPASEVNAEAAISVKSNLLGISTVIFEKDSDKKLPIASLTKLMTAVVVLDNYNLSDMIVVGNIADAQDPMKQDVKVGDTMPVESFLQIMLIGSSNKSAYALSEKIGEPMFVELMNKKAKEWGLKSTFFADPTGLNPQNVSTAGDLIKLAEHILRSYPKISDISKLKELDVPNFGKVINTDQLLGEIPDIICSKTGFTEAAKGCLLLVVNNSKTNDYIINVILGADDRFSEMEKLINWCK
jgi:D-alanyl-D-alanine carboxypeptidase